MSGPETWAEGERTMTLTDNGDGTVTVDCWPSRMVVARELLDLTPGVFDGSTFGTLTIRARNGVGTYRVVRSWDREVGVERVDVKPPPTPFNYGYRGGRCVECGRDDGFHFSDCEAVS